MAATVVFFPEGAYGPTNNCIGIGDVLRRRGHRVVFIVEESFAGALEDKGFEERLMRLTAPADQHQQDRCRGPDLGPVLTELAAQHELDALPGDKAEQGVCLVFHSLSLCRFRTLYAIRDCSDHSSMKPGLACCENSPPDSPNPASAGSYNALGDRRATGRQLPL